jgi:hypothetical protein
MRKILTGCIIATAISSTYPAAAQIFSYSYTDTNQLAMTLKPATQSYLRPAGADPKLNFRSRPVRTCDCNQGQ